MSLRRRAASLRRKVAESRLCCWLNSASTLRSINGWATVAWGLIAFPAILWWRDSVPFLVGVSVYANLAGHLAAWQSSRVEVREEERDA